MFTLFRASMLNAKGAMKNLSLGKQCWVKNDGDYLELKNRVQQLLADTRNPYAVYDVATLLLGIGGANRLSQSTGMAMRIGLGDKRPREGGNESDDDDRETTRFRLFA
jgi:hypothetical protein